LPKATTRWCPARTLEPATCESQVGYPTDSAARRVTYVVFDVYACDETVTLLFNDDDDDDDDEISDNLV